MKDGKATKNHTTKTTVRHLMVEKFPFMKHFKNISQHFLTTESAYLSLLLFLILGMVHVPIILRFLFVGCFFFNKRILRIACPFILSIAYFFVFDVQSEAVIIYLFSMIGALLVTEHYKAQKKDRKNSLYLFLFSMTAMAMLDFLSGFFMYGIKATYVGGDGFPSCFLRILTIFMMVGCIRLLQLFIKNIKISALITYGGMFFIGSINYWVMEITNSEFLLSDLKLIKTAAGVISEVQIEPVSIFKFIAFLIIMTGFFVGFFKLSFESEDKQKRKKSGYKAILFIVITVLILRCGILDYSNYYGSVKYGVLCNLIINLKSFEEPTGYDSYISEIKKEEARYTDTKTDTDVSITTNKNASSPNIIVIMSEAFSDLSMVKAFQTNMDYIPYTRSILESYPSGTLYASVRGNNTVSSEMEFLTGIPTGLSMKGCDFYQLYLDETEDSMVSLLEEQDYHTIGIHPYASSGYNRKNAWDAFGFDETYFLEDFEGDKRVRNFVSDEAFYENIIEKYEANKEGDPVFIYGISMQNHASYYSDYDGKIKITDTSTNGMDKALNEYEDVNEYLSLLYESDLALKELLTYFESQEEDTLIVFYGDHQPLIDVDFYSSLAGKSFYDFDINEQANVYKIPYFIWSNFDTSINAPDEMSINFLPNTVLDAAGLDKNAWFEFSSTIFKTYPVITDHFMKIEGEFVEKETVLDALSKITTYDSKNALHSLKKYQIWSYEKVR